MFLPKLISTQYKIASQYLFAGTEFGLRQYLPGPFPTSALWFFLESALELKYTTNNSRSLSSPLSHLAWNSGGWNVILSLVIQFLHELSIYFHVNLIWKMRLLGSLVWGVSVRLTPSGCYPIRLLVF